MAIQSSDPRFLPPKTSGGLRINEPADQVVDGGLFDEQTTTHHQPAEVPAEVLLQALRAERGQGEPQVPLANKPLANKPLANKPLAGSPGTDAVRVWSGSSQVSGNGGKSTPTAAPGAQLAKAAARQSDGDAANEKRPWMRRPTGVPEIDERPALPVDPAVLPPPIQRKGLTVSAPVEMVDERAATWDKPANGSGKSRNGKTSKKRSKRGGGDHLTQQAGHAQLSHQPPLTQAQILDTRAPGKYREDSAFMVPLIPALIVTAVCLYGWFQGAVRLSNLLPLSPLIIGVLVGIIMRLGSRVVDFARVGCAIILTFLATLWGHGAIKDIGPLNELAISKITWSTFPKTDPVTMLGAFHNAAELSLPRAALMFSGLIAAGLVASLNAK